MQNCSGVGRQGQRQLTPVGRKDFEHELWIPATRAAFHGQTAFAGVLLEQGEREAIQPGKVLTFLVVSNS